MTSRNPSNYSNLFSIKSFVGLGTESYDQDDDEKTCNDLNSISDELGDKKTI